MDGLQEKYGEQVDFYRFDANSAEGKDIFRSYGLVGHPGFVLIDQEGAVLWIGQGEPALAELESHLEAVSQTVYP